jgi:hypothetical protein
MAKTTACGSKEQLPPSAQIGGGRGRGEYLAALKIYLIKTWVALTLSSKEHWQWHFYCKPRNKKACQIFCKTSLIKNFFCCLKHPRVIFVQNKMALLVPYQLGFGSRPSSYVVFVKINRVKALNFFLKLLFFKLCLVQSSCYIFEYGICYTGLFLGGAEILLFGVWSLCSMVLFFCFSCNLNAILLAPNYDKPIDTACQVLQQELVNQSRMRRIWCRFCLLFNRISYVRV